MPVLLHSIMIINSQEFGYPIRHIRKVPFLPTINISQEINRMNIEIFHLESELDRFILTFQDHQDLVSEAFSSNIHVSTQLEGNPLTNNDVKLFTKKIVGTGKPSGIIDFPHQEILNHLLAYLDPRYGSSWDLNTIKSVHDVLLHGDSGTSAGEFRTDFRSVQSSSGQELFIPAPPQHIEDEMSSLIQWLNNVGPGLYPIIAGAIFFHEFESIHPFEDGNGRTGRSLFHIYLQHHGLPNSKLCFIEQNIVSDPEKYYELLARTDFSGTYEDLIFHFTKAVHASYIEAVERYRKMDLLSSELDEGAKRALRKAKQHRNWFTIQFAKHWFDNASDHIVRIRLNELVERGALISEGRTRGKRYRYVDPIEVAFEFLK